MKIEVYQIPTRAHCRLLHICMASAKYGDSQIILTSWGALGGLGRASGRGSSRVATFPQLFLSNPARLTDRPESYTSLDLCRTLFIKSYPDSALFMIFNNSSFVINSFDAAIPDSAADSKTSLSSPSSMINFGRLRPPDPRFLGDYRCHLGYPWTCGATVLDADA